MNEPSTCVRRLPFGLLATLIVSLASGSANPADPQASSQALGTAGSGESMPFARTEERAACADYDALRRPMFGDLHVHTSYSFDSYISSQRNDPADAYRYAKGEAITLPDEDGNPSIEARIQRPLDFTSVTDHPEYLGQIDVCTQDPGRLGYW